MSQELAIDGGRNGPVAGERPDPEVVPKAKRRRLNGSHLAGR